MPDPFTDAPGLVRNDHPDTSREAAWSVMPRSGTQRRKVLDYITRFGPVGATDEEIQRALSMAGNTERPRRVELVRGGHIYDCGQRRHGHIVWCRVGTDEI